MPHGEFIDRVHSAAFTVSFERTMLETGMGSLAVRVKGTGRELPAQTGRFSFSMNTSFATCIQTLIGTPFFGGDTNNPASAPRPAESPQEVLERMRLPTVLYAEDSDDEIVLTQAAFERAKTKAHLCIVRDGQQAIDYLAGNGTHSDRLRFPLPRLVLLDYNMPRKNGLEVLQWIRRQSDLCCMPVVIIGGSLSNAHTVQAKLAGANSVLQKPTSFLARVDLLRSLMHYWLDLDNQPDALGMEPPSNVV